MLQGKGSFAIIAGLLMLTAGLTGCATPGPGPGQGAASACLGQDGGQGTAESHGGAEASPEVPVDGEQLAPASLQQNQSEPIKIGTLLPLTGQLKNFGPDMQAAVELAAQEINDGGGVLGRSIEIAQGDSQTDPSQAPSELNRLITEEDIVGFVGAASSGVSGSVIEQAVNNEIVMVSPASTSPALTEQRDNNRFFYRVVPSDALQGRVMAQLLENDGISTISTLYVNNDYGQGFNDVLVESFSGTVENQVGFDNDATQFSSQVSQVGQGNPEAVVFIGYPGNGVPIMREAFSQGLTQEVEFYFSEGVQDQSFVNDVGNTTEGVPILAGCKGTTPQDVTTNASKDFREKFREEYDREPGLFAAHSYDALTAMAAAIAQAGTDDPSEFKQEMLSVWNSPGQKVSDPARAVALASTGTEIDYEGASNDFDWAEDGEPETGVYGIWQVQRNGTITTLETGVQP